MRLRGSSGYNRTIPILGHFSPNPEDNTVDMFFGRVDTSASYTLSYVGGDGTEYTIIQNAAYDSLEDTSESPANNSAPSSGA